MASILPNPILSKSKFLNWIKAALAVLFTKEEIEPVVHDEIQLFQQKCLQDIFQKNNLPSGSTCSNCCTENVVVCPTNRICNIKRGKCKYHRNAALKYRPSGCPNIICHCLKTKIQDAHRYQDPSYRNTDATQWCSNPWEIAKCYMPPDGYEDVQSAADTDFNGIISVIINHILFETKITDDLSKKSNIFDKGREVGKAVRHSPNLEVEDADLAQYFTILNNILNDTGFKSINKSPHNGGQKLAQLQSGDLVIGKDVVSKVLDDVAEAIQERIRNETNEFKIETEKERLTLIDMIDNKVKDIEAQGNMSVGKLNETLKSSVDAFEKTVQESSQKIKQQVNEAKQTLKDAVTKGVQDVAKEKENVIQEIEKAKQNRKNESRNPIHTEEKIYQNCKIKLRMQLIKFYKNKRSTVPLSPLVEEKDTHLAGFYVMPEMVSVIQKSRSSDKEEERIPVKSLIDLFINGSDEQQEIYLTADAGYGKTSFSKYLAIIWGQACCPDYNKDYFKDEELNALANFEFLFLVLLRDSTAVCTIDEMIEQQIIKKLPPPASLGLLQEILEREKCLIILDGLDEWTHPENSCPDLKEKIPHRYVRDNCVILTTTRPWKLGILKLKTSEINKKVELVQLSQESTRQLETNAIRKMSDVDDVGELEEKTRDFNKVIASRGLKHMQNIPLLLMYIACLWCNKISIGDSKVDVYVNIIEFLLSRTAQKYPELHQSESSNCDIPEYFKKHTFCQKFCYLLKALAELAYHTLYNEKRENTLVFDGSDAEKYLKADDMKLCLLSGILTGSTTTTLTERTSKVSFSHKTVQEFFAAIFMSSQSEVQKKVLEKCKNVQSILDMSMICEFISKMDSKMMCNISAGLMSVIDEDEEAHNYRTETHVHKKYTLLYNLQEKLFSCLREMPESENFKFCLQDFFIDRHTIHEKRFQRLSKLNKTNMKSLYVDLECTFSSLSEIVELFSLVDLNNLKKLEYYGHWEKADISVLLFPSLQTVRFASATWTNYEGNFLQKLEELKTVQYLDLSRLVLSHEMLETIFNFISGKKTLKTLSMWGLSCKEHRFGCNINFDLSIKYPQLKTLELYELPLLQLNLTTPSLIDVRLESIKLGKNSLLLSSYMLNIENVGLFDIEISSASLYEFINVVEELPQSVTVKMSDIKPEKEYKNVRKYVSSSKTFIVIKDSYNYLKNRVFMFKTRKPSEA